MLHTLYQVNICINKKDMTEFCFGYPVSHWQIIFLDGGGMAKKDELRAYY